MIRAFVLGVVCAVLLSSCAKGPEVYTVTAPNGELAFHISNDELGRVHYSVSDRGTPVINDSRLGFAFANAANFADALYVAPSTSGSTDLLWEQISNKDSSVIDSWTVHQDKHGQFPIPPPSN